MKKRGKSVLRRSSSYMGNVKCITLCALILQCSLAKGSVKNCPQTQCVSCPFPGQQQAEEAAFPGLVLPQEQPRAEEAARARGALTSQLHLSPVCRDATSAAELCL